MKIVSALSDDAILAELGARIAAERLAANLTQAMLADRAGVSKRTVERLESGEVAARLSALVRVCRALGLVERFDALLPAPVPGPVERLKMARGQRKRATRRRPAATAPARAWTWGDES